MRGADSAHARGEYLGEYRLLHAEALQCRELHRARASHVRVANPRVDDGPRTPRKPSLWIAPESSKTYVDVMWMGSMSEPEASCISPACTDSGGISQSVTVSLMVFPLLPERCQTVWCHITAQKTICKLRDDESLYDQDRLYAMVNKHDRNIQLITGFHGSLRCLFISKMERPTRSRHRARFMDVEITSSTTTKIGKWKWRNRYGKVRSG